MVSTNGITDIWLFLILLSYLGTIQCVWQLALLIRYLANIVQKTGTLSLLRIQAQLRSHDSTEISSFTSMLQKVLTIRRTILHLTYDANQLRMQAMDAEVNSSTLTSLDNLILQLLLHLGNYLLDTGWVNTTVSNQLMESQTANLTTHWIESRNNDSLRSIIHYDFYTGSSLQCTDITTFTTDDTALHLIVINMEYTDRVLDSSLRSHALDSLDNDFLSLLVSIQLSIINNFIDIAGSIKTRLILQTLHETILSFLSAQSGKFFQLSLLLLLHLL